MLYAYAFAKIGFCYSKCQQLPVLVIGEAVETKTRLGYARNLLVAHVVHTAVCR